MKFCALITFALTAALAFAAAPSFNTPSLEVLQDGGRVGRARPVIECVGDLKCNIPSPSGHLRLSFDGGSGGGSARSYLAARIPCPQASPSGPACWNTTGVTPGPGAGDHIAFKIVDASNGGDITLDTSTNYQTSDNVASTGRFTLSSGKTYWLWASVGALTFASSTCFNSMAWFNADTGTPIGPASSLYTPYSHGSSSSNVSGPAVVTAAFAPGSNTRVEVRTIAESCTTAYGAALTGPDGGAILAGPYAFIEVLQ